MVNSNNGSPKKRIAALDLGTNSFHAVIVDIYADGSFRTVDKLKEMVILAEKGMDHHLSKEAMERGLLALKNIKVLCDSQGVDQIIAYATSAIREAENGGEFIQRMIDEIGIKAHAISGRMEAELIGYAVQHSVFLGEDPVLIVDIGGGSVEFIVGNRQRFYYTTSKKIGVARMTARFVDGDPITEDEIAALRGHFRNQLSDLTQVLQDHPVDTIIGSSGTMENIAQMIANRTGMPANMTLNELEFSSITFKDFYNRFIALDRSQRLKTAGLEEKRVDIINSGLVLLNLLIEDFGINKIKISESALREGMILNYIKKEKEELDLELSAYKIVGADPRRRSVFELLRKCNWHARHSTHVAEMALQLFDDLKNDLKLLEHDRELLEYAALMHDIGYYISHRKHHKHALYLIRNADLKGFREDEINLMAHVARYHRRSTPKKRHRRFSQLSTNLQERIRKLAAILRVADGLDRSHYQNVKQLDICKGAGTVTLRITTESDPELEIWGAMRKRQLFEEVTGKTLKIVPVEEMETSP